MVLAGGWVLFAVSDTGGLVPVQAEETAESTRAVPRVSAGRWAAWQAARAAEPSVDRVVEAVLRHRRGDPDRMRSAMRRARRSGWLPRVTLEVSRGQQRDWWWQRREASGEAQRASNDEELRFEVALRFDLSRILYAPEEGTLLARERAWRMEREALIRSVVDLYFERRRLLMEVELFGVGGAEALARIEAIEAWLRWLSGGAFRFGERRRAPPAIPVARRRGRGSFEAR